MVLKESHSGSVGSRSNIMSVTWGDDYYRLSSTQDSVFPCTDRLVIDYTRPKCVIREDNIHMFAKREQDAGEVRIF